MKLAQTVSPVSISSVQQGQKAPLNKSKDLDRQENGSMIMNQRNLRLICENQGLYEYPQMNNKIYLHFKTIEKIQGLDKYLNLKTLYLENNVITKIENIDCLTNLQNLFLQNNMIKKIEGLSKLKDLRVLNLNNNNIFKIEGLIELDKLQNLNLANNYLTNYQDLEHLGQCTTELTSIDVSQNQIKADQTILDLIPQVKCLYLIGNPLVRETKHYRRLMIGKLKNLLYLDERGIDNEERMLAEAWINEGDSGFRNAREKVLELRQVAKSQKRQEIMKDIDVHRNKKIAMFLRNIQEFEEEIQKLRGFMNEKGSQDMHYFYENQISDLQIRIQQNQQFIQNINKRIGAAAKSLSNSQQSSQKQLSSGSSNKEDASSLLLEKHQNQEQMFQAQTGLQKTEEHKQNINQHKQKDLKQDKLVEAATGVDCQQEIMEESLNKQDTQNEVVPNLQQSSSSFSKNQFIPTFEIQTTKQSGKKPQKIQPCQSTPFNQLD